MTNAEILKKAIQKALDRGWPSILAASLVDWNVSQDPINGKLVVAQSISARHVSLQSFEEVIYDRYFTKALWGDEEYMCLCAYEDWCCQEDCSSKPMWQYHLQQMVIAEDPIKYMGDNI